MGKMPTPFESASFLKTSVRFQRGELHSFGAFVTCDVLLPLCSHINAPLKCGRTGLSKLLCLLAQLCCLSLVVGNEIKQPQEDVAMTSPLSYGLKNAHNWIG